ncbi:MAG: arsenite methyltransferase [Candidatus Promineofilum sp.]|nr:arsenite methyltransferase [Promineifilum sp.]
MNQSKQQIHEAVQERYGRLAVESSDAGCCSSEGDCCGTSTASVLPADVAVAGAALDTLYSGLYTADTGWLPPDVTGLSLGCGDPITLAALQPGQTVLDLGSGGGIDAFMAARQVGPAGHVIGVDMTPQMLAKAESNKAKVGLDNVEFRQGYIEALPVADNTVDVILSNCVINLSPDKAAVFREAYRVLRPGGRLAVSDMMTRGLFTAEDRADMSAWAGCITGAEDVAHYAGAMRAAGFMDISIVDKAQPDAELAELPLENGPAQLFSARVTAVKGQA